MLRNKLQSQQNHMAEPLVIFRHIFGSNGSFSYTEPIDFVLPDELVAALDALTKESREFFGLNFVLETITLAELNLADFKALLWRLQAQGELYRLDMAIGFYMNEHLVN